MKRSDHYRGTLASRPKALTPVKTRRFCPENIAKASDNPGLLLSVKNGKITEELVEIPSFARKPMDSAKKKWAKASSCCFTLISIFNRKKHGLRREGFEEILRLLAESKNFAESLTIEEIEKEFASTPRPAFVTSDFPGGLSPSSHSPEILSLVSDSQISPASLSSPSEISVSLPIECTFPTSETHVSESDHSESVSPDSEAVFELIKSELTRRNLTPALADLFEARARLFSIKLPCKKRKIDELFSSAGLSPQTNDTVPSLESLVRLMAAAELFPVLLLIFSRTKQAASRRLMLSLQSKYVKAKRSLPPLKSRPNEENSEIFSVSLSRMKELSSKSLTRVTCYSSKDQLLNSNHLFENKEEISFVPEEPLDFKQESSSSPHPLLRRNLVSFSRLTFSSNHLNSSADENLPKEPQPTSNEELKVSLRKESKSTFYEESKITTHQDISPSSREELRQNYYKDSRPSFPFFDNEFSKEGITIESSSIPQIEIVSEDLKFSNLHPLFQNLKEPELLTNTPASLIFEKEGKPSCYFIDPEFLFSKKESKYQSLPHMNTMFDEKRFSEPHTVPVPDTPSHLKISSLLIKKNSSMAPPPSTSRKLISLIMPDNSEQRLSAGRSHEELLRLAKSLSAQKGPGRTSLAPLEFDHVPDIRPGDLPSFYYL